MDFRRVIGSRQGQNLLFRNLFHTLNTCGDGSTAFPQKPDGHINVKVEFGEGEGKVPLDNIAKKSRNIQAQRASDLQNDKGVHRS